MLVVVDVDVDDDVVNNNMMNDTTLHDVYEQEKKKRKVGKEAELKDSSPEKNEETSKQSLGTNCSFYSMSLIRKYQEVRDSRGEGGRGRRVFYVYRLYPMR